MRQTKTQGGRHNEVAGWRIQGLCAFPHSAPDSHSNDFAVNWPERFADAARQGFDVVCIPEQLLAGAETDTLRSCANACADAGLRLMLDVKLRGASYATPAAAYDAGLDALLVALQPAALLLRGLETMPEAVWPQWFEKLRARLDECLLTVWTPGMTAPQLAALEPQAVDAVYSSLPWWNFRDGWLIDEYERLRAIATVIAPVADHGEDGATGTERDALRRLAVAAVAGDAVLVPSCSVSPERCTDALREIGSLPHGIMTGRGPRRLTGPLAELTALIRADYGGRLLLVNPDPGRAGSLERGLLERRLPHGFVLASTEAGPFRLDAGDWIFLPLVRADSIAEHGTTSSQVRRRLSAALRSPRIAIEAVRPAVDDGGFAVKRSLGEVVTIRADIFMDGHEELAAELLWRPVDESDWSSAPMRPLGNDVWEASFVPRRLGRYVYAIRAWWDKWASFCVQLKKKVDAGVDVSLEVEEGRRMLAGWLGQAEESDTAGLAVIEAALEAVGAASDGSMQPRRRRTRPMAAPRPAHGGAAEATPVPPATAADVEALLDPALAEAIYRVEEHAFQTETEQEYPLNIERSEAVFASWYELFPRSQSPVEGKHGTFRDVIERLPMIRRMGFDVLYFPPIHPIGRRNRKGRNNSLQAGPDDPGSPYAIGSGEGGHDAVHPELGTLEDFHALVEAAREHGLEIALDFAIQCSPDHPWLSEHPDWFNWRVDGTLKYAENPPKKYEDIVNPDFYSPLASTPRQAALWRALRDVVLFWIHHGVHIFRVDNPHTKPLPFWQWLLQEVRDRYPDTIFLSEAFTRPAMMYRLAKIGFSQSYTYFTWRNTKQELTEYMTELNRVPVRDFFRPNFFVNTPDINPWFLQTSGRAGFLIRAVLASTLSGSWGMYNGFELCVGDPVPGKEEYLDSEKYELRRWDMNAPGNIIPEITRLNRIRRNHAALQSHLGVRFHEVENDQILFYSRYSPEGDSIVLVAVSLDPHNAQTGRLHLARSDWGISDHADVPLHDLFEDRHFRLHGPVHEIVLTPDRPFVVWALDRRAGGPA